MITNADQAYKFIQSAKSINDLKTIKISLNFTWFEVFTKRTLAEAKQAPLVFLRNAVLQANLMEFVRQLLKKELSPNGVILVHSWYRPAAANAQVGGATGSSHLKANATDFSFTGFETLKGQKAVQAVIAENLGKRSFCLEITNGLWTHVDRRPGNFIFENKGNGSYPVLTPVQIKAFIKENKNQKTKGK